MIEGERERKERENCINWHLGQWNLVATSSAHMSFKFTLYFSTCKRFKWKLCTCSERVLSATASPLRHLQAAAASAPPAPPPARPLPDPAEDNRVWWLGKSCLSFMAKLTTIAVWLCDFLVVPSLPASACCRVPSAFAFAFCILRQINWNS